MDNFSHAELRACISELYKIANELEEVSSEISASIQGMNTVKYTRRLYRCAEEYRKAARNLEKIH